MAIKCGSESHSQQQTEKADCKGCEKDRDRKVIENISSTYEYRSEISAVQQAMFKISKLYSRKLQTSSTRKQTWGWVIVLA